MKKLFLKNILLPTICFCVILSHTDPLPFHTLTAEASPRVMVLAGRISEPQSSQYIDPCTILETQPQRSRTKAQQKQSPVTLRECVNIVKQKSASQIAVFPVVFFVGWTAKELATLIITTVILICVSDKSCQSTPGFIVKKATQWLDQVNLRDQRREEVITGSCQDSCRFPGKNSRLLGWRFQAPYADHNKLG